MSEGCFPEGNICSSFKTIFVTVQNCYFYNNRNFHEQRSKTSFH